MERARAGSVGVAWVYYYSLIRERDDGCDGVVVVGGGGGGVSGDDDDDDVERRAAVERRRDESRSGVFFDVGVGVGVVWARVSWCAMVVFVCVVCVCVCVEGVEGESSGGVWARTTVDV